jgi:hypothetical protein
MTNAKGGDKAEIHVASAPVIPRSGDLHIDARPLESFLRDLAEGATQGMRREQEGIADVIQEITANQEKWGPKAGVTPEEVAGIVTMTAQIAQIRAYRPAVAKLLEMLDETEAELDDKRDTLIHTVAGSVDVKALTVGEELIAKYEHTRAYRSAAGHKAAKTRKKNADAAAPKAGAPGDGGSTDKPA